MLPLSAVVPFLYSAITAFLYAALCVLPARAVEVLHQRLLPRSSMATEAQKPSLVKTVLARWLHISPTATKLDLKSELTVRTIRAVINQPKQPTVTAYQAANGFDRPAKGPVWASRASFATEKEDGARQALLSAIHTLGDGTEAVAPPPLAQVKGEWVGYRKGVDPKAPEPSIPENEKYERMMGDASADLTILYVHGGSLL